MINNDMNFFLILVSAIFINNVILSRFIGLCPFFGLSNQIKNALGMSAAVTFVMVIASSVTWSVFHFILYPYGLVFLRTATFILTIASLVQLVEMIMRKYMPPLYRAMGIYLPLITTNCAILGLTFLNVDYNLSFINSIVYSFGVAGGFALTIILFAGIRERIMLAPVPAAVKGYPLAFFTASLMSLAFLGFKGLFGL